MSAREKLAAQVAEVERLRARVAELETALADATEPDVDGAGRTYQEYQPAPRDLRPGADAARRMIRDRDTTEDAHDGPLHHTYALGRDLPGVTPWVDPCHPCGCPKRFDRHAWGCPTLPEVAR